MNKWYFIILASICFAGLALQTKGQVPPVDLNCVFNQADGTDTLRWNTPVVNCGPIEGFEIYQSEDKAGPYTLVNTLTDPSAVEAVITNMSNRTYYYYILIDADCPGETAISSDTISNTIPPAVQIRRVSVENGNVLIEWVDRSDSIAKIAGYVIYRVGVGTIPIDTVYGSVNSYIDMGANPDGQPEIYFVQAIDGCGFTGPIGSNPHHTMHLIDSLDTCARTLYFEWTPYIGWMAGIEFYELMVSVNGGSFNSIDTIFPPDLNARLRGLDVNNNYSITIRAKENGRDVYSNSNLISITPAISQGVNTLHLWGADIENGNVNIQWNWNADAEFVNAELIRGPSGTSEAMDLSGFIDPAIEVNEYSFNSPSVQNGPVNFAIRTLDECDSVAWSDTVRTSFVSALALNTTTNRISVSRPVVGENVTIRECELLRLKGGMVDQRIPLSDSVTIVDDEFSGSDDSNNQLCYQLLCNAEAILPDGTAENFTLRSNTACPLQEVRIQVPNAFRPEGTNIFFKPIFLFESSIQDYSLQIFDRWGQLIFETRDPEEGWYGMSNGEPMKKGVYVYRIAIVQTDGSRLERQGNVLLLR